MTSDDMLLIRCPHCGQRFKVQPDLRGRTVECGGCENRFQITDEVIYRARKFYPGERKDPILHHFQRVALPDSPGALRIHAAHHADTHVAESFEPTSPLRVIAGLAGVSFMVLMALLLMFGAERGGVLDGMTTDRRLIMAGFTSLLGLVLLVYANPKARFRAFAIGVLLGAGLVSVPFFFTAGSKLPDETGNHGQQTGVVVPDKKTVMPARDQQDAELRTRIGTRPLEEEIARLAAQGSGRRAVGLWLRNLRESNRFLVRDYMLRMTKADPQSHFYPRGGGDFLMVVTGINQSLDEVSLVAAALGTIEAVYPDIPVVEVRVNNESFVSGPIEKLSDKNHPEFYDLNKRELECIDLDRVSSAVKRLSTAEPKMYRYDLTLKLVNLLGQDWVTFKPEVCNALAVWAEKPGPAGEAALKEVRKLMAAGKQVPEEMISLLLKERNPAVLPILDELWSQNPSAWEAFYGNAGMDAESLLIRRFPSTSGMQRHSAVRLLGRVGGIASVPLLEAAANDADSELKVLIQKSLTAIRERSGTAE